MLPSNINNTIIKLQTVRVTEVYFNGVWSTQKTELIGEPEEKEVAIIQLPAEAQSLAGINKVKRNLMVQSLGELEKGTKYEIGYIIKIITQ